MARRGVCDTRNVDLVGSIGADRVIDYTSADFTNGGEQYDVIYDAVGKLRFGRARLSLTSSGVDLATDLWQNMALALLTPLLGRRKVKFPLPAHEQDDVVLLAQLIQAGHYQPVIDRCYPLERVIEATRYVATGQKTGADRHLNSHRPA